jgi:hypothetical protein
MPRQLVAMIPKSADQSKSDSMKRTLVALRSLRRIRIRNLIVTINNRLLSAQERDLSPAEIDERFRILLQCGF